MLQRKIKVTIENLTDDEVKVDKKVMPENKLQRKIK